jgi:hypothetical protein
MLSSKRLQDEHFVSFCWKFLKERDCLECLGVDGEIILKVSFEVNVCEANELVYWLRTDATDRKRVEKLTNLLYSET